MYISTYVVIVIHLIDTSQTVIFNTQHHKQHIILTSSL